MVIYRNRWLRIEASPVPDGRETSRALHTIDVRDSGRSSLWPLIPEFPCVRHAMAPERALNGGCGTWGLAKGLSNVDGNWGDGGLSQRASRGGGYGRETGIIDLGNEPPLSVDGSEAAVIDRRRVSVQWFSGTILTGLCGAALIGGAVFASLDGEMTFAKIPERVDGALRGDSAPMTRPLPCTRAIACRRRANRPPRATWCGSRPRPASATAT